MLQVGDDADIGVLMRMLMLLAGLLNERGAGGMISRLKSTEP